MSDQNDPMAEIRASFFIECEELLEALQDGLQALDDGDADSETINVVFRAVHSIKGGAGAFGLEALVRFAHRFETALDEVRSDRMSDDAEALKVFFQCSDHLCDLVRLSREDDTIPEADTSRLLSLLDNLLGSKVVATDEPNEEHAIDFQPATLDINFEDDEVGGAETAPPVRSNRNTFNITFTPENALFETGNEPFQAFRILEQMGDCSVYVKFDKLPEIQNLQTETCYLSWTIRLVTAADEAEVASAFEFVEGLCDLDISLERPEVPVPDDKGGFGAGRELASDPPTVPAISDTSTQPKQDNAFHTPGREPQRAPDASDNFKAEPVSPKRNSTLAVAAKSVVRVDLDRIERLVNLVGELVINQAMLAQSLERSGLSPHSDAMNGLEEFQRLTRDIQDSVMMIRAQPVKSLFQRMSRIVREASAAVDKDARLYTDGESTEVDKTVIERLADPLTHMIRNAIDHGLETPEDRIAAGKPQQGCLHLSAAHRSGRVVIEVSDDGKGINRSKVLQIAIKKGLVPADANLTDSEIDNLLFLPGFSTASVVSDLSGRGVGMDVVRTAIQELGGRITISSTPGTGTTFSISLPLTLAVLDGMVVQVAGETLVLPLNVVIETLTLSENDVESVRPDVNVVRVRDGFVPLFDLGHALGYRDKLEDYSGRIVLLIAHEDGSKGAIVIDSIQDQRQIVIKGLDDSFYRAPGIAAATILGDGQIALIVDASDIITNSSTSGLARASTPSLGVSA